MLQNPGFEGPFERRGAKEINVCRGWAPWHREQGADDGPSDNRRPEWRAAAPFRERIRSGDNSQQWFTWSGTHDAGVYQVVDVPDYSLAKFSIWMQQWCQKANNQPAHKNIRMMVGIDPHGGVDPFSDDIVWGEELRADNDKWIQLTTPTVETSDRVTLFIRSVAVWPVRDNNVYVDDAQLDVTPPAAPEPEPDPEPEQIPDGSCLIANVNGAPFTFNLTAQEMVYEAVTVGEVPCIQISRIGTGEKFIIRASHFIGMYFAGN